MKFETAESVTLGHPDKLADYIADSILDEALTQDENARVAVEVMISHDSLFIAGEITADAEFDCTKIAEEAIRRAGYEHPPMRTFKDIDEQSGDISQAVDKDYENQGAGDQGIVYGYATDETLDYLPLATSLAHRLTERLMDCFHSGNRASELGPDGKAQVTVAYNDDGSFSHIDSVLVSVQHPELMTYPRIRDAVMDVIVAALGEFDLEKTTFLINPSGRFVTGGFEADTGLTGRKIMVDTYGGLARHGGRAFSGKDPSKLDRSGAYMARFIAKNIVAAGLAQKCEVSIAYAIGCEQPTMVNVNTFGTEDYATDKYLTEMVKRYFDLTPKGITDSLRLTKIRYADTAAFGHFGREEYPWEKLIPNGKTELLGALKEVLDEAESN